ncbi:MAG: recombination regulator RecX [Bacteroidetes bacterium]|nr:recombination regulator RecX [Bacteroidota bacterium]
MRIVRVEKKDEKNVVIFFDNEEKLFLSYEIFLKNGLKKNDEISESRFSLLIEENQKFHLKQKAFRLLGRRHHSSFELKVKLKQKGYDENFINEIINDLKSNGYLNDYEFALVYAEENIKNKYWGKKKVEAELFKRGIERNIIAQVVKENFPSNDDLSNAVELGKKKLNSLLTRKIEKEKIRTKLYSFLLSKGYDYEICKKVIEALISEE